MSIEFDQMKQLDEAIIGWGEQGFEDIAAIVYEDNNHTDLDPILSEDEIISQLVVGMKPQGRDLFVTLKDGNIVHYRMTVERV